MKTNQVMGVMFGAALLSGAALAQADGPQGPARGEGSELRAGCRCGGGEGQMACRGNRAGREAGPMQERGGFGREFPRGPAPLPNPQLLKEAGATDQQIETLKKLEDERLLKQVDLKAAAEKAELTFGQLMRDEKAEEAAVLKAADALSQARAEIFKSEIASQLKVRATLGNEVMKKLHEMRPPMGENRCPGGRPEMDRPRAEGPDDSGDQARRPRAQPPAGERPQAKE